MHVQPHQPRLMRGAALRRLTGAALVASFIALLAAIPTGSALASSGEGDVEVTTPISLTAPELNETLASLPLADVSKLSAPELSALLASLPALKGKITSLELEPALLTLLGKPGLTLEDLTSAGLLGKLLKPLGLDVTPNEVLTGLLGAETTAPEAQMAAEQLIAQLGEAIQTKDPADTSALVEELLGTLDAEQIKGLEETLGSTGLTPKELTEEITEALEVGNPGEVEPIVQELLGGLTFQPPSTLGDLASKLGTSVETLATDLGTSVEALSGGLGLTTASALPTLVAPLTNGKLLTVVDGPEGLKVTTLESKATSGNETAKEKEATKTREVKESKEAKERAEGGTTTTGTTGTSGSTTVVVTPSTPVTPAPPVATKAAAKIKILSHRVKGHVATLVLQVPAAGKVVVSGGGVKVVNKSATKSERVTVRVLLSKAGTASLRKRHNRLSVALKASFKPKSGASSSAGVTVHFA